MIDKLVVVAIGGNSLIRDPRNPHIDEQWESVRETCRHIADMIADGWQVIITHGNGPQVGYIMRRAEIARREAGIHEVPLDWWWLIPRAASDTCCSKRSTISCATSVKPDRGHCHHAVRVDPNDPAFQHPDNLSAASCRGKKRLRRASKVGM